MSDEGSLILREFGSAEVAIGHFVTEVGFPELPKNLSFEEYTAVCGGIGSPASKKAVRKPLGLAWVRGPSAAGGMPLGWYGGCVVLTDQPSGVTLRPRLLLAICTAPTLADGEAARFSSFALASSRTRMLAGASAWRGVQAQISHWWFR